MKKISLKRLPEIQTIEKLTVAQLQDIMGGNMRYMVTGSDNYCMSAGDDCTTGDGEAGTCRYQGTSLGCS